MYKFLLLALFLLTGCTQQEIGLSTLKPVQGGTGISSATAGDVGKALVVSDDSPFTYSLQTVSGTSSGGGSTTTLSATNVAYGNTDNTVTGTPEFYYTSSTQQLTVPNVSSTSVTSTNLAVYSTSTFYNDIVMSHAHFLTTHGIKGDASDGLYITANNDTAVANFGVGNSANSTFSGGVNIDGQTRLATSLTGLAYLTSGVVSAITTSSLGFLTVETDPIWIAASTSYVRWDAPSTTLWDTAYGWGNHALAGYLSSYTETDPIWTSASTSYLRLDGGTMTGGLQFINATSTGYFVSRTSTIQGGFFQTGLSTCNADGETLAYNATTGKFECGDDDSGAGSQSLTNTLIAFGDANNQINSSSVFSFTTSTGRLLVPNVSSTSVTTTNLSVSGSLSLPANSITDAMVVGALTIDGGTINNTPIGASVASTAVFSNATSTNFFSSGLSWTNGNGTSITSTNGNITTFTFGTAVGTSVTTTNLSVSGALALPADSIVDAMVAGSLTLTGGSINNVPIGASTPSTGIFTSITSTWSTFSTTTISGGFFQTDFTDCDADNQTVAYDITTGKFGCGDDDSGGAATVSLTATLIPFGNTDNSMTSSTALSYVTSTNYLVLTGTVSSTNGLFLNATSTNFFGTNGTFTRATSTDFNATRATFTSITSTNISYTRLQGTSITSTNLSVSSLTSLAGLTFTNATGTGQFRIATTTVTGGFFQTDLANCNADTETISYNATTGKFGCGDDDINGVVSTTRAQSVQFTDATPANFADNNTTELWNDTTRPNITPQSANNPVLINVSYMIRGASATDNDFVVRVVRENDPGSTTPTCDLTSDAQVGASTVGGTLISAFTTNLTDNQTANGVIVDFPATTTAVYYTVCTSASSTVSAAPTSSVVYVGLTEIQGAGAGAPHEYTRIYTASTTWTKPVTSTGFVGVYAWCVGGGGGGGGSGTAGNIGGGGAGGGASYEYIPASSLTSTAVVTVGVAGAGGAAGNNNGTAGETSSFGTFITCTGGNGGNAGNGASSQTTAGVGSGGDINGSGRNGREPGAYTDSYRGYGGAAGTNQGDVSADQIQDSLSNTMSGGGILGIYAGGGGTRPGSWDANSRNGNGGQSFGGGGSGGQKVGAGADASGANGAKGVVVIVELYN